MTLVHFTTTSIVLNLLFGVRLAVIFWLLICVIILCVGQCPRTQNEQPKPRRKCKENSPRIARSFYGVCWIAPGTMLNQIFLKANSFDIYKSPINAFIIYRLDCVSNLHFISQKLNFSPLTVYREFDCKCCLSATYDLHLKKVIIYLVYKLLIIPLFASI